MTSDFPTVNILGFPVARLDMAQVIGRIDEAIQKRSQRPGKTLHIITANAEILYRAHTDPEAAKLLKEADLITPDGIGTVKASKWLGGPVPGRVTGIDLLWRLTEIADEKGWSIYMLGAAEETVSAAVKVLQGKWPKLNLAGWHNGYFKPEERPAIIRGVLEAKPDILFVALGFPGQDLFIREMIQTADPGMPAVSIGVGGSFDAVSGTVKRAPEWVQKLGIEWVYRFAQNPKRLNRAAALPKFVLAVLKQRSYKC